jgi:hypothetical protein
MSKISDRPVLISSVNFWWYPLTLIPLLALLYFSFTGALPLIVALISVFLLFFWLFSLGFALYARLRKPPKLRQ